MKLLKLKIKNIHSLKGEHVVDFSQGPLAESGLFAITGPTGSGKSTLLDAITLALFNKIPRFAPKGTENLSKTEIDKAGSVITHHTDEAWAEVEYEAGTEAYRSTWKISRARTGNLKDYEMTLARLSDSHNMDLKKSEVPAENERILGLKYEQFIRSIILAQGDFARLLKSDEKERAKLLEDITGSHIYREIGKTIFERAKEADQIITALKQEAAFIPILSEEQLFEKQEARKNAGTLAADLEGRIQKMNDTLVLMQRKKVLNQALHELNEQWNDVQEQKKASQEKYTALQLHASLLPLKPTLALWQQAIRQRNTSAENIKNVTLEKTSTDKTLEQTISALSDFTGFDVRADNYLKEAMRFRQEIHEMDMRLTGLKDEGSRYKKAMEDRTKDLRIASVIEVNHEPDRAVKLQIVNLRLEILEKRMAQYSGVIEDVHDENKRIHQELEALFEKANLVSQLEKIREEEKQNKAQINVTEQEMVQKTAEVKGSEKDLIDIQGEVRALTKEKEEIFKQASLDELRTSLTEGAPCPLCGSMHHPFGHKDFASSVGVLEIKIQTAQRKLEQTTARHQQLKTDCAILVATLERCTLTIQELTKQAGVLKGKVSEDLSSEVLYQKINTLKNQIQTREKELAERTEFAELSAMKEVLEKILALAEQYISENKHRKNRYVGHDIEGDIHVKITVLKDLEEQSNRLHTKIETLSKEYETAHILSQELQEELKTGFLQSGIDSIDKGVAAILEDTIAELWMYEKNVLDTKEVGLQTRLEDTHQQLAKFNKESTDGDPEWLDTEIKKLIVERNLLNHEIGAIGNELKKNHENITSRAEKEELIAQKIQKNESLYNLNALIGDAQGVKYAKFAQNISLRTLLRHANTRLTEITDRYRLVFTDIDSDLTVEDLYQGNTRRSVKTLSGGETFMVSLAMALSLSDMASSHVQLESIFIDEGFGTLDMETLEAAIITLEKLQAKSRKTIGIISHVPMLKERIHTQVMLKKNNLGYSEIEIRG